MGRVLGSTPGQEVTLVDPSGDFMVTPGAGLPTDQYVWDTGSLAWVRMSQPILNAGSVVVSGAITVTSGNIAVTGTVTAISGTAANLKVEAVFPSAQAVTLASTTITGTVTISGAVTLASTTITGSVAVTNANLDVALSTLLKPADTLAAVTTVGTITNPVTVAQATAANLKTLVDINAAQTLATVTTVGTLTTITNPVTVAQATAANLKVEAVFPSAQAVTVSSGTITAVTNISNPVAVTGTFWQSTQPVSIAATVAISAAALPLPADAATQTTLAAASAKLPAALGQTTMANSMSVALASNQSLVPVSVAPVTGSPWQIKGSLSHTPTIITDTFPPSPLLAWRVPTGKTLTFTGGVVHSLAATQEYYRVCRRYFMYGNQQTAAPSAPAAPTTAVLVLTAGIATAGVYLWKIAPVDCFGREGALSAASNPGLTLTSTNRGATVTGPALGTGVVGYNVYRTLADGSTYYYVGQTLGVGALLDALPDASVDQTLTPSATWATGEVTGETATGPVEIIIEGGAVAPGTPPGNLVYTDYLGYRRSVLVTWPTGIGQRIRAKLYGETSNFIAVPVVAAGANAWHGTPYSNVRNRLPFDYGALTVVGANVAPASGSYIVWGQQVIATGNRTSDPVLGTIHSYALNPMSPNGVVIPAGGEIVVEVGSLGAGVAGVRDVTLGGILT